MQSNIHKKPHGYIQLLHAYKKTDAPHIMLAKRIKLEASKSQPCDQFNCLLLYYNRVLAFRLKIKPKATQTTPPAREYKR